MGYVKQILGALLALPAGLYLLNTILMFAQSNAPIGDRVFDALPGVFSLIFLGFGVYLIRAGRKDILKAS